MFAAKLSRNGFARSFILSTILLLTLNERQTFRFSSPDTPLEDVRPTTNCQGVIGKNGTWVRDWDFAERYGQYESPRLVPRGPYAERTWGRFQPSTEAPFPWEASWKWVDSNAEGCQIDYTMDADKVCRLFLRLKVNRLLFFGDSLAKSQFESFLNTMGRDRIANFSRVRPENEILKQATLLCDNSTVPILFANEGGGNAFPRSPRTEMIFSNHSRDFVHLHPERLLAVLNIGAHYHQMQHYQEDLATLFQWLDESQRPDDIIFFRTTPSGHKGCSPRNPKQFDWTAGIRDPPLTKYADFVPTTDFDWNLFDDYNTYTRKVLTERSKERTTRTAAISSIIRLLDVVNMTILRQDGHSGGPDCLHYASPGPVDWWNHLLFTELQGI